MILINQSRNHRYPLINRLSTSRPWQSRQMTRLRGSIGRYYNNNRRTPDFECFVPSSLPLSPPSISSPMLTLTPCNWHVYITQLSWEPKIPYHSKPDSKVHFLISQCTFKTNHLNRWHLRMAQHCFYKPGLHKLLHKVCCLQYQCVYHV